MAILEAIENWLYSWFFNFWELQMCKIMKNPNFQALLEKKLKVVWKKFPGLKLRQIVQKIHFLALEVVKTTFRWIFWRKSKNQKIHIFHLREIIFSRFRIASAWKKFFFQKIESSISQLSYALSSVKKYWKLAFLRQKQICADWVHYAQIWEKKNCLL